MFKLHDGHNIAYAVLRSIYSRYTAMNVARHHVIAYECLTNVESGFEDSFHCHSSDSAAAEKACPIEIGAIYDT